MDLIKVTRQLLKKVEAILVAPPTSTSHSHNGVTKWDVSSFMSMPVNRVHFGRRKKVRSTTEDLTKDELVFFKSMSSNYNNLQESKINPYAQCDICIQNKIDKVLLLLLCKTNFPHIFSIICHKLDTYICYISFRFTLEFLQSRLITIYRTRNNFVYLVSKQNI
jgi:hypothetical protein